MNKEKFLESIKQLGFNYDDEMICKIEKYYEVLVEYNKHTNLTRIIEKDEAYLKHFYDSLTIKKVINLEEIVTILDFGTGAGFPGVVLKIFYPNIKLTLLDSNNKKTKFLMHLCEVLNLKVEIVNDRAENFTKKRLNYYDVVIARAVANMRVLTELSLPLVKESGYFIAMKANSKEELKDSKNTIEIMDSQVIQVEEFILSDGSPRSIIKIQKNKNTKMSTLRQYDKIVKQALVK